jgi:hypothetical protein
MNLGWSVLRATRKRGAMHGPASAVSGAAGCARLLLMDVTDVGTVGARVGDQRVPRGRRSRSDALQTGGTKVSGESSRAPLKGKREEKE